jgi:hypothetical protein
MKIFLVKMDSLRDYWLPDRIDLASTPRPIEPPKPASYMTPSDRDAEEFTRLDGMPPQAPAPMPTLGGDAVPLPMPIPTAVAISELYDSQLKEYQTAARKWDEALRETERYRTRIANRQAILERIGIHIMSGKDVEVTNGESEVRSLAHIDTPQFSCSGEQLIEILASNDVATVISTSEFKVPTFESMAMAMEEVVKRFEAIDVAKFEVGEVTTNYNSKCEVHIPGQALSTYNEVMLLEDACSDALQDKLDSGWRMIAGCPQPDNRRPDYILGRFNSNFAPSGGAKRG